jgi:flagellar protein FlaF
MSVNPLDAYQEVATATLSGRELEASILNKAATQLLYVKNNWDAPDREAALDQALRYNQHVWSFFQSELSAEDNPLPIEVKRNLLTLSMFIDKRTFEVMAFPAPEKLAILISINQNVAAGLLGG